MTIRRKLSLGIGILLVLFLALGIVSYFQIGQIDENLTEITQGKESGKRIGLLYRQQRMLDEALKSKKNHQDGLFATAVENFEKIDNIIDAKLRAKIDLKGPDGYEKMPASSKMAADIVEVATWLGTYLQTAQNQYKKRIFDDAGIFEQELKRLRNLPLTEEEKDSVTKLEEAFEQTMSLVQEILVRNDDLKENGSTLRDMRAKIDTLLDEEFEILTRTDIERAKEARRKTVGTAVIATLILVLTGFLDVSVFGAAITRSITEPITKLKDAVLEMGKGDFDTKIQTESDDEIGQLAAAFNQMADQRKEVEQALRVSEGKLNAMLQAIADHVSLIDKDANIIWANELARKMFGEDIIGKKCYEAYHGRDTPCKPYPCLTLKTFQDGKIHVHDTEVTDKEGKTRHFHCTANVALKDEDGQSTAVIEVARDITERKLAQEALQEAHDELEERVQKRTAELAQANKVLESQIVEREKTEQALRDSEQRLNVILNSILTGVVVIDAETHEIVDANPLALELIGAPIAEVVGKVCHEFICPAERGKCPISDLGQTVDQSECVLIRAGNKSIPIIKTVTTTVLQGHRYFVESFLDMTARKKAEEALEKLNKDLESAVRELRRTNKELEEFAYVAAHDLKTPLRAIGVLAHWLSTDYADQFDERGKGQVKLLVGKAERMSRLVDSLLEYSRTGQPSQELEEVDLNTALSEVITEIDPPENIEITVENDLPTIICDKTRMMQVFDNLLSNAVKYMDKPEGRIKVGCVEEDGFWKFSVADNGPGIEPKYFEKIFKIFQTLSPRDGVGGTGIGLSIVKKTVELNGGRVWAESEPGEGSTFFFTLPEQMAVQKAKRPEATAVS